MVQVLSKRMNDCIWAQSLKTKFSALLGQCSWRHQSTDRQSRNIGPVGVKMTLLLGMSLLSACAHVSDTVIDGTVATTDLGAVSDKTQTALDKANIVADKSLANAVISRRFSQEAARGEKPLLSTKSKKLPILAIETSASVEETVSPVPIKDARFGNFTLDDAIKATLGFDVNVAQAAERLTRSEIAKTNATFGYLPRVQSVNEFLGIRQNVIDTDNAVFQAGEAEFSVLNARVEATQPIFDLGQLFGIRVASLDVRAAEMAYISAAQRSAFETISAYTRALEAQGQAESVKNRLALLKRQRAAEVSAERSGVATQSARELVDIEIGRTEIELLEIISAQTASLTELGRLVGQPVNKVVPINVPLSRRSSVAIGSPDDFISKALRDNPEMNRLRLVSLRQRSEFKRQAAEDFAPRLEALANLDFEDRGDSRFGGGSETLDGTIGLRLTVPIFNANGRGYVSREVESEARNALLEEANLRRALETEIRSVYRELVTLKSLILKAEAALRSSKRLLADARRREKTGLVVPVDVVRQKIQVERAKEWVLRSKYTFVRSWARFSFLTGESLSL